MLCLVLELAAHDGESLRSPHAAVVPSRLHVVEAALHSATFKLDKREQQMLRGLTLKCQTGETVLVTHANRTVLDLL